MMHKYSTWYVVCPTTGGRVAMPPHSVFLWDSTHIYTTVDNRKFLFCLVVSQGKILKLRLVDNTIFISSSCCAKVLGRTGNREQCWWTSTARNINHLGSPNLKYLCAVASLTVGNDLVVKVHSVRCAALSGFNGCRHRRKTHAQNKTG